MSSVNEFETNLKLLNEALGKLKSHYGTTRRSSSFTGATLDAVVQLQALAIYVEKGAASRSDTAPATDGFDRQVWEALKQIESKATATDIAQGEFNELFAKYQKNILKLAKIDIDAKTNRQQQS